MLTRRGFIQMIGYLSFGCVSGALAKDKNQSPVPLPQGIGVRDDWNGPLPSLGTLGKIPALKGEVKVAQSILAGAPAGPAPFDVAQYFLDVGSGKLNSEWTPYVKGWPERWNPVIVTFFEATDTKPEGDLTSWCAAFLNWCFLQSGKAAATHSASSGSFRSFGQSTSTPKPGDIVVFKSRNPNLASKGRGHVGFFVSDHGAAVEVLGGNQIEGHEHSHMISSKRIPKHSTALLLHSYRTVAKPHAPS